LQIEKTVKKENLITADSQEQFKQRYLELCNEFTKYLEIQRETEEYDEEDGDEPEMKLEWQIGDIVVYIDSDSRTVLQLIRAGYGLKK